MLSIIIPTYNSALTIRRCINSILRLTSIKYEILLIDDGSLDRTVEMNNYYSNHYNNIHSFCLSHKGPSMARNFGLKRASGKWICFIDSDDYINSNKFYEIIKKYLSNNVDLIVSNVFLNGNLLDASSKNYTISNVLSFLKKNEPIYENEIIHVVWNKIFKTSIIYKYNIQFNRDMNMGEDFIFNLKYLMHVKGLILQTNIAYYIYYIHKDSITNTFEKNVLFNQLNILKCIKCLYSKYHISYKLNDLKVRIIHHVMLNALKKSKNKISYLCYQKRIIKNDNSLSRINVYKLSKRNRIFLFLFNQPSMHLFYICNCIKQKCNKFI